MILVEEIALLTHQFVHCLEELYIHKEYYRGLILAEGIVLLAHEFLHCLEELSICEEYYRGTPCSYSTMTVKEPKERKGIRKIIV